MRAVISLALLVLAASAAIEAKNVKFTYYWITFEKDYKIGSEVEVKNCKGGTLARVSREYFNHLKMECSGVLKNGWIVNGGNKGCTCFNRVSAAKGSRGNDLVPYVSIAANDIPFGSKVYVKQLDGVTLPSGERHNGCVRVDDVSWSFKGDHIDFYVYHKKNYNIMSKKVDGRVDISVGNCSLKRYKY